MRRTPGKPFNELSIGRVTASSSSSAAIEAFCVMTLKTGTVRFGKDVRRQLTVGGDARADRDHQTTEHERATLERRTNEAFDHCGLLMRMRGGAAHGLRLQRESALDDDAVAGLYA